MIRRLLRAFVTCGLSELSSGFTDDPLAPTLIQCQRCKCYHHVSYICLCFLTP